MAVTVNGVRCVACSILCMLLATLPLPAQAQHRLEAVKRYVGKVVVVHDLAGLRVSGRLIEATVDELTLTVDGARRIIPGTDIASIGVVGDPVWDGALKAIGVGVLLAVLGSGDVPSCDKPCFRESALSNVLGVAMFGAVGAWIDARHTRERVIYEKP